MQNYYQFLIPRLNGDEIRKNFKHYLSLVRKGIAGFIIFGGKLNEIRKYIQKLQDESEHPLIISSDLEQGLGQQIKGGTLFPPAMAIASAIKNITGSGVRGQGLVDRDKKIELLKKTYKVFAEEAKYAGINAIFAPVLDINTNPKNPIISVRAFGEDAETVSFFGCEMIKTIQRRGLTACGKHFPGHGDTEVDSHIKLPLITRILRSLKKYELKPFDDAIKAGVKMIMLGHLSVPAIDPSGIPVSFSEKAVRFIRNKMDFNGILITDAMNMGGIGKYSQKEAAFMALKAGVDIILHPTDIEKVVSYLKKKNVLFDAKRLAQFRRNIIREPSVSMPDFSKNKKNAELITKKAIRVSGNFIKETTSKASYSVIPACRKSFRKEGLRTNRNDKQCGYSDSLLSLINKKLFLIILNDEEKEKGRIFEKELRKEFPNLKAHTISRGSSSQNMKVPDNAFLIIALFSETRAWKGGAGKWLSRIISAFEKRIDLLISFGSPYLLDNIKGPAKMSAYWDSDSAQKAAARIVAGRK